MYDRVKAWVFERGGRLMYLGGNGLNCEVEFLDDAHAPLQDQPGARRRSRSARTIRHRRRFESRLHRTVESEANLLGVV